MGHDTPHDTTRHRGLDVLKFTPQHTTFPTTTVPGESEGFESGGDIGGGGGVEAQYNTTKLDGLVNKLHHHYTHSTIHQAFHTKYHDKLLNKRAHHYSTRGGR